MSSRPGSRPWLLATLLSGTLLVISIIIGLQASLSRISKTMDIIDQDAPGTRSKELSHLVDESTRTTRLALYTGLPIAAVYLISFYMYRKSKRQAKSPN